MTETSSGVSGLFFHGQKHEPAWEDTRTREPSRWQPSVSAWLSAYFSQTTLADLPPLDLSQGTPLQRRVWQALLALPPGTTCSYGALAAQIGQPRAVRAVAAAIGRNPLSLLIPCHRVIGAQGALTGYAGGLWRKQWLLEHEGAQGHRPQEFLPLPLAEKQVA